MSSFAEVRIAAERLEVTEFGRHVADAVRALIAAGDYTALPPGVPFQPLEVDAWLAGGVHRHRRDGGGVHLMMQERASGELVGRSACSRPTGRRAAPRSATACGRIGAAGVTRPRPSPP